MWSRVKWIYVMSNWWNVEEFDGRLACLILILHLQLKVTSTLKFLCGEKTPLEIGTHVHWIKTMSIALFSFSFGQTLFKFLCGEKTPLEMVGAHFTWQNNWPCRRRTWIAARMMKFNELPLKNSCLLLHMLSLI
jgi:hypothetical protein